MIKNFVRQKREKTQKEKGEWKKNGVARVLTLFTIHCSRFVFFGSFSIFSPKNS